MKPHGKIIILSMIVTVIFVLSSASILHAFGVVATISLRRSGGCYGLAYDSNMGEVFVANGDTDSVYVISDKTNSVVAEVPVGRVPYGAAYDSGMGEVFVANHGADSVSVISDLNNTVVATVKVGSAPSAVAYDSGKSMIFVANYNSSSVSVIADKDNTVVANITVGTQPCALAYDSAKNEIFVGHAGSNQVVGDIGRYKCRRCKHNRGKSTLKFSL